MTTVRPLPHVRKVASGAAEDPVGIPGNQLGVGAGRTQGCRRVLAGPAGEAQQESCTTWMRVVRWAWCWALKTPP